MSKEKKHSSEDCGYPSLTSTWCGKCAEKHWKKSTLPQTPEWKKFHAILDDLVETDDRHEFKEKLGTLRWTLVDEIRSLLLKARQEEQDKLLKEHATKCCQILKEDRQKMVDVLREIRLDLQVGNTEGAIKSLDDLLKK